MNQFLSSRYVEVLHSLALGIEPIDALGKRRLTYPLQIGYDAALVGLPRPPIERHASNLYSLRYQPGVIQQIDVRFFDMAERIYKSEYDRRRIVPRRLRIPILTLNDVRAQEAIDKKEFGRRIRRPVFFPGAAFDIGAGSTGMRGRVLSNNKPMRWARVEAKLSGGSVVVGRAHGDDRGEFLLLLNAQMTTGSSLPKPLMIEVSVFGPATEPVPVPPTLPTLDPLWDLPLEILAAPGDVDPVANGVELPSNYIAKVSRDVEFTLGKCLYEEFEII